MNRKFCGDPAASRLSKVFYALKSRYTCIHEPLPAADATRPDDYGRYLTSLRVFGSREVDELQSPLLAKNDENDCDVDVAFSKKQSEFAYVKHTEEDNPSDSAAAGIRRENYIAYSEELVRKRRRAVMSCQTVEEAAHSLGVSRSTLKLIHRSQSISRWPYTRIPNDSAPLLNPDQTDAAIHASDSRHVVKVQPLMHTFEQNSIDPQRVEEKVTAVLKVLRFRQPHVLVQFWSPVAVRKRCLLTTLDQPFGLGVVDEGLYMHRLESEQCMLVVDEEHREELGPPARVYRQKLPEWSLDMHGLSTRQSVQDRGSFHNNHGYIDLPVFEPSSGCCVGVLELITSSNYVDYAFEVQQVSNALEGENLKSPNVLEDTSFCARVGDNKRQLELAEIFQALKMVRDSHNLPLAQTWGLCGYSSVVANSGNLMRSCSSFSRNCIGKACISTAALPFCVGDMSKWGFHDACRKRHLDKSQGIVGRSLSSRGLCFCGDVSQLGEEEYPLAPFARMHGIASCIAIYLKSIEADDEYVVELFLPTQSENEAYVLSLVKTMKQHIKNASRIQLGDMSSIEDIGGIPLNWNLEFSTLTEIGEVPPELENLHPLAENEKNDCDVDVAFSKKQSEFAYVEHTKEDNPSDSAAAGKRRENYIDCSKKPVRRRKRADGPIGLEEISKYFGKPMDEAADSLGVSRSILKRLCRIHDIPRWPYRRTPNESDPLLNPVQTDAAIEAAYEFELGDKPSIEVAGPPVDLSVNQMDLSDLKTVMVMSDTSETDYANVTDQQPLTNASMEEVCDNFTAEKINLLKEYREPKSDSDTVLSTNTLTVNVRFKESIEQLTLLLSDGLLNWEKKVANRFKIEGQRARLKYWDEDNDLILICDDDELKSALHTAGGMNLICKIDDM